MTIALIAIILIVLMVVLFQLHEHRERLHYLEKEELSSIDSPVFPIGDRAEQNVKCPYCTHTLPFHSDRCPVTKQRWREIE